MYAADRGSTGAVAISWLIGLLAGKIGQEYSCGPRARARRQARAAAAGGEHEQRERGKGRERDACIAFIAATLDARAR